MTLAGTRPILQDELTDLFVRNTGLFNTVSVKLSTAPTLFWGTSFGDNNSLELICGSEYYSKTEIPKWIVVYPADDMDEFIEDLEDLGFNIIIADTSAVLVGTIHVIQGIYINWRERIFLMTFKLYCPKVIFTGTFFPNKKVIAKMQESICEITVAMAAPEIPI